MKTRSAYNPTSTTKAYYPLNNDSNDYSGQNNGGTPTAITYPQGKFGQAANLVYSSSYITVPYNPPYADFTMSFWMKTTNTTGDSRILTWRNTGDNDQIINIGKDTSVWIRLRGSGGTGLITVSATTPVNDGQWKLVTCTFIQSTGLVTIYVNGRMENSNTYTGGDFSPLNAGFIGKEYYDPNYYGGLIDEVIIESRAWTPAEVSTYYRKSMLNYGSAKRSIWNILGTAYNLITNAGLYTLTGNNILFNRTINLITSAGSYTLTGINITFSRIRQYIMSATTGIYNLIGNNIFISGNGSWKWRKQTKNTSTYSEQSKNSSIWTEQNKN